MAVTLQTKFTTNKAISYFRSDRELIKEEKEKRDKNLSDNTQILGEMSRDAQRRCTTRIDHIIFRSRLSAIKKENYHIQGYTINTFKKKDLEKIPLNKTSLNFVTLTSQKETTDIVAKTHHYVK